MGRRSGPRPRRVARRALICEGLEPRQLLAADTLNALALERGDFDHNDTIDANDIDLLATQVRLGGFDAAYDANRDGQLNADDQLYWVESIHRTYMGDSNLDGKFGTSDLTLVFQAGLYEDNIQGNATWTSGDWNGDTEFSSGDLLLAFQRGGYELGLRPFRDVQLTVLKSFGTGPLGDYQTVFADVDVQGQAEPLTLVTLRTEGVPADEVSEITISTDEAGNFEFPDVSVSDGANDFSLLVTDANGQQQSTPLRITRIPSSISSIQYAPWGDTIKPATQDELIYAASAATAYVPSGMTQLDLAKQLTSLASQEKPLLGRASNSVFTALLDVTEGEASDGTGGNDTVATAELVTGFGTGAGEDGAATISGVLLPVPVTINAVEDDGDINKATVTNLTPGHAVVANETIGDGPFGSLGLGTGDSDFYAVRGVLRGQVITIDINTPVGSLLDTFLFVYDSAGNRIDFSDDDGISTDSFLEFTAPDDGNYFLSVAAFGSFGPINPFDSASGIGVTTEGDYEILIGLELPGDVDMFAFELEAGDILGATVNGGPSHLTLRDSAGNELFGSPQDASYVYPASSPLPRDGRATISWVVDTAGTYVLAVDGGVGAYELDVAAFRPYLETQPRGTRQVLFLDFDGASIDPSSLFGFGASTATLDPLANFLPNWGLSATDENAVIDAIVATVAENFADVGSLGNNGDRAADGTDGHYQLDIVTSRDLLDAAGFPFDPFGSDYVSRVIVGGTIEQLGARTIGIAESIDPGNFNTVDTAVVLLDLLSSTASIPDSLNNIPLAAGASIIDLIGVAVGNIVTHEAGHFVGSWHTNQFNSVSDIMDQGGNLPGTIGLGPDKIFGSADDVDVDFGRDTLVPNEGFTGVQSSLNVTAFGLSTGTVDLGMVVSETVPGDNRQVTVPPTDFLVRFLDPYDAVPSAGVLTVNGIQADSVTSTGSAELMFSFRSSPVTSQGLQQLQLAAGAVLRVGDLSPVAAYSAEFGYDALPTVVTSVTPAGGLLVLPFGNIDVTFSEPYDPASVGVDDLQLTQGDVVRVNLLDNVTVQYVLGNLVSEGPLQVTLPGGAVTDAFGNWSSGFEASYTLDIGRIPFQTPLEAKLPLGSLIYDPVMTGTISSAGDADFFTILVDPGQSISVLLETDTQLKGEIDLVHGNRIVGAAAASVAGEDVIIQNDPVTGKLFRVTDSPTEFEIRINGIADSTGQYRLSVLLNSAFEEETYGFPVNDALADAQSLEPAFRSLRGNSPDVAAVLGTIAGGLIVEDDFESGQLDPAAWVSGSSTQYGQVRVTAAYGAAGGSYALLMDVGRVNQPNLNWATWTVDLSGHAAPILSFDHVSFSDEPQRFVGPYDESLGGIFRADGIAISGDGNTWYPVFDAPTSAPGEWLSFDVDLGAAATAAGIDLSQPLRIRFQQFDDFPIFSDGRGWDNIRLRDRDPADWYRIELNRGTQITLATTAQGPGHVELELYDAAGQLVAPGLQLIAPVANGGFETGSLAGWQVQTSGTASKPWQVSGAGYGGDLGIELVSPQDGNFAAWSGFDGEGPMDTTLYQDITIPAGSAAATLSWQQRIQWLFVADGAAPKTFEVQVRNPADDSVLETLFSFDTPNSSGIRFGDTGWHTQSADLSAYTGTTVRLAFFQNIPETNAGPGQIELDQIHLDLGQTQYDNVNDAIVDYLVDAPGDYFVRVSGDNDTEYSLLMTRNVDFDLEQNDDFASAQSLGPEEAGRRWMLGHLDGASDASDFYIMRVPRNIELETFTPAGADGEFVNQLDPMIRIYDIAGNLVAEDDNSNGGINAGLTFRPDRNGSDIYYIEVLSVPHNGVGGAGEYVLAVRGAEPVSDADRPDAPPAVAALAAAVLADTGTTDAQTVHHTQPSHVGGDDTTSQDQLALAVDWLMADLSSAVSSSNPWTDRLTDSVADLADDGGDAEALWPHDLSPNDPLV